MVTAWHATSLETEKTSLSPLWSFTESSSAIVAQGACYPGLVAGEAGLGRGRTKVDGVVGAVKAAAAALDRGGNDWLASRKAQ
jgi:hypothetical protein